MRKIYFILFLILVSFCVYKKETNTIEVYGHGEIKVIPDYVNLTFSISNIDKDPESSQKENINKSAKIIKALKDIGIKENNIYSINYNLSPEYRYVKDTQKFFGYRSINSILVKIENIENYKNILSKILSLGVNNIDSITFGSNNYNKLKLESMSNAVDNALEKARKLTSSLEKTPGDAKKIIELDNEFINSKKTHNLLEKKEEYESVSENQIISKGERIISTDVLVIFELK
ncbi:MAG: SIMPL domain-containing protein [Spirochaetia bacterium]|nr:SIMPL domain-containing protein [Spirochaetia bacterium]